MKKTVLITGACVNTGVDIVKKFASEGWNVIFTGRDLKKVQDAEYKYKKEFPAVYIEGYTINSLLDEKTIDEAGVTEMFDDIDKKGLFVETLVLNAADQGLEMKIFESSPTDFQRVINTNITWNYFLCESAAKRMIKNGGGNIIFINSNTAYRTIPNRIAYATSKGGQLSMMKALALDLGKFNIRVNAILPGMIRTDRWEKNPEFYANIPSKYTPIGDVASGSDIADAVWYFATSAKNTTGAELIVDGGNSIQLYPIIPEKEV